jgi:hypothetical protein
MMRRSRAAAVKDGPTWSGLRHRLTPVLPHDLGWQVVEQARYRLQASTRMSILSVLFGFRGRRNRAKFWLILLLIPALVCVWVLSVLFMRGNKSGYHLDPFERGLQVLVTYQSSPVRFRLKDAGG